MSIKIIIPPIIPAIISIQLVSILQLCVKLGSPLEVSQSFKSSQVLVLLSDLGHFSGANSVQSQSGTHIRHFWYSSGLLEIFSQLFKSAQVLEPQLLS